MGCVDNLLADATDDQRSGSQDHLQWYAVYTYPRHERAVTEHLQSQSLVAYLPTILTESSWKDRRVRLHTPIFPSYVFAQISLAQRSRVLSASGVVRILSSNGKPAPIANSEIEALKLCLDRGAAIEHCPTLEVGDRVRVRSGVLEGLIGQISRCKKDRRLIVPITLIHQSVAIEIDMQLLEPLDEFAQPLNRSNQALLP
ncbi:MAG: UpxY family transcription antiterminator [Edaphobacter sp.]